MLRHYTAAWQPCSHKPFVLEPSAAKRKHLRILMLVVISRPVPDHLGSRILEVPVSSTTAPQLSSTSAFP